MKKNRTNQNKKLENIKVVIFDMDGTLIDSEKVYYRFWKQAAQEAGFELPHEHILMLRSFAAKQAAPVFQKMYGPEFDFMAIRERRRHLVSDYLDKNGIVKKPGVDEALKKLKEKGYRLAVATATSEDRAIPYLERIGIRDKFDKIISTNMVKEGKPAPDIYLYACEQMGEKPENCVAVEDAPNGIISASKAGCRVIMIPDLSEPDEKLWEYLDGRVDSMFHLEELL